MWQAIGGVSNIFALLAIVAVVVGQTLRRRYLFKERAIKSAPQKERSLLVEAALDQFSIDREGLTKQQRYDLALEFHRRRAQRFTQALLAGVVVFLVAGGLSAWAWKVSRDAGQAGLYRVRVQAVDPSGAPVERGELVSSLGGEVQKVGGGWEINLPDSGLPTDRKLVVHIQVEERSLSGSGELALGEDLSPSLQVALGKKEVEIFGIVVDESNAAVGGARVSVVGHPQEAVTTDASGQFRLPAHAGEGESVDLRVEKQGYESASEVRPAGSKAVNVQLYADADGS